MKDSPLELPYDHNCTRERKCSGRRALWTIDAVNGGPEEDKRVQQQVGGKSSLARGLEVGAGMNDV